MNENQASFTAMVTAYIRAYHSMHATNKIFDDFLAYSLIPEEIRTLIEQHSIIDKQLNKPVCAELCPNEYRLISEEKRALIEQYFTRSKQLNNPEHAESQSDQITAFESLIITNNIISRARYTEDTLEKVVNQGVKQYVILGAGLDTFAFRRPEMMELLEVFEVDHPATQEFKLHRLAELGWKHPAKLHFVSVDFTQENLITALTRSSAYDPDVKSFFSWLGVKRYLTREEVFSTLRSIARIAPAGSTIVFNYSDLDAFTPEKLSQETQKFHDFLQNIGEPVKTGLNPSTLAEDLACLGFRLDENLSPAAIERLYFQGRTDGYHMSKHGHFARAVVE
jgi:methyltransferase (TIGR00027 family)